MDNYGILSIVPAILVVRFVLRRRRTLEALLWELYLHMYNSNYEFFIIIFVKRIKCKL